jgi:Bacterial Ig-like domain (group 3)/FG-GAP-like repeat
VGVVFELSQHGDSLIYSSFLGGGDYDTISAIAVDGSDNAYVTGTNTVQSNSLTTSGFPVTSGVIWGHFTQQNIGAGFNDAFAAKITPPSSGNAILAYSTVIGSAGSNTPFTYGSAIAVDSSGDAYIAGSADCNIGDHGGTITTNLNMSHVTRAQSEYVDNVWVLELNPAATAAPYIAYLGGSAPSGTYSPSTSLAGIKVDSTGQAYVAGTTEANNFQTTSGAYQATKQLAGVINSGTEQSDGFVTVIAAAGASFTYSTYLNGTTASPSAIVNGSDGSASISGIALGTGGQFAVSGLATTTNFPISGNPAGTPLLSAFPGCPGSCASDVAFITKFTTSGLVYSTFLGAGNEAGVNGIASNGTDMFVLLGEPSNGLNSCGAYDSDNSSGAKELVVRVLDAPAIATAVSVDAKTANVSSSQQTISLTSTISASSTVNEGTATYTVTNSSVTQIGSAVTSEIVSNGLPPSLSFTLPANTPIGTYTIREQYCGAEGFLNSSATGSLIVSSAGPATTTSVTSSLNPSGFGQSVTFTATVTSAAAAPTGSVQFEVDGANLGGAVALTAASSTSKAATSQATTTLTATGSPHTVQANYLNSDGNFSDSSGTLVGGQTVTLAGQATLTVTGVPVTAQPYGTTFTVGSSGGSGTGAVTFAATGSCSVTGTTVTITSGSGTCSLTATKAADANYINATSAAVELQVTRSETITTLVITPGTTVNAGTAITLTATIPGGYPGTVTFCTANAAQCSAVQLNSSGIATRKFIPGVGIYSIVAAFGGTSTEGASSSAAQTLTINGAGNYLSSTSIAATGVPSNYTLTGTVTGFGIVAPSGTVNFLDTTASTTIGSATLDPATVGFGFVQASGSPIPLQFVVQTAVGWEASGDFNDDGIPDLAVVSSDFQSHVYVLLGIGDGTFHAPAAYAIGEYTGFVTVADVNNDGHPDIIVANTFSGNVGVLLGNANGTFGAQTTFPVGSGPSFVAVGDVNGDGSPDLIVANTGDNTISVLLGDGTGHFATQVTYSVGSANGIAIGDFNGDGKPDLAVSNSYVYPSTLGSIDLLLGNGDGTFLAANSLAVPSGVSPSALGAADLRKDGRLDLIFADNGTAINPAPPAVYLMLANNDGTFGAVAAYPTEDYAQSVSVGDINHDGILDVVVPDSANDGNGTSVSVLIGNGDGTLKAKTDYLVGGDAAPYYAVLADFNGDGLLDISTANYSTRSVTTLLQQQVETATLSNTAVTGSGAQLADASYPGDTSHAPSLSTTTSLTPTIATTNTLTSSGLAVNAGASVTFTATIVPVPIGSTRGAVSFYSNGVLLGSGSVAINPFGVATYTTTGLAAGSHAITAVFSGNASYSTSTSAAIIETITAATTSILTVAPNPVVAGQSAIFTLTISPAPTGSPLGTVSFYNGSTLLWTGTVNSSGVAIFSTTTLPLGADSITAAYSGNAGFAGSTSTAISVQVNSANATATVTAITSSNLAPTYGQSVTLTATVTPAPSGTPPGTLSFYAGTTLLGTEALNAHGVGIVSLSLPLGPNAITAVYSGSAGFAASRSSALSISNRALSAIMLSASPTTQLATMPVVFTGLVNSATPGVQTGTVSFLNGSMVLATVTIVAGQPAVYSDPALSSGPHSVTATYSGDGSFLPSASNGAPISITVSDLNLALSGGNNKSVVPGGAVTYNFTLSPVVTSTFLYSVALTATGLPPGATYTFSHSTIPAGSGTLPVAFTVQTAKTTAMLHRAPGFSMSPWFALIFGLLLPLAGAKRFRARLTTLPRVLLLLLFGGLSLGLVAGLGGCGSGGFLGSPPGQTSYTITISATSGTLVRTSTVQLSLE